MKLLVVLSRVPYPLDKGDKLRAWYQLKELKKQHEIHLLCLDDTCKGIEQREKLKEIADVVEICPLPKWSIALRTLQAIFSKKPFQVCYFNSPSAKRKLRRLINSAKPDHIFVQMIRTSELVKNEHQIAKTLDFMDALSKGAERRIKEEKGLKKLFWKIEWQRLIGYENLMFDYFDNKLIISEQDRDLIYHQERKKIHILPNGVDTSYYSPIKKNAEYELVFVGNLSYLPNIQAAQIIAKEILPSLNATGIKTKLLISGASPSSEIKILEGGQITVSGWINDIRTAYSSGKIFVAPMQIGTGMQNKLLEAMSMGIPVITTPLAWKAIGGEHRRELLIANDTAEFVKGITELLSDKNLYSQISENARNYVFKNYSWEKEVNKLNRIICKTD
ncbi:MAG: glycosyltransferase [Flavobacteriales bacterium]